MFTGDWSLNRKIALTRGQALRASFILCGFAIALTVLFAFQPMPDNLRLDPGQVSPRTILAPERVTFISEIQTQEARARAEAQVKDVYDPPNAELARERVRWANRVLDYVDSVRNDPYSNAERKIDWVRQIPALPLSLQTISRTLTLDDDTFHRIVTETLYVLDQTMRETIRSSDIVAEYGKIPSRISLALPANQAELVTQWTQVLIVPNSFLNPVKTEEQRAFARSQVQPVYRTIEKGQAVLREGEVVTPAAVEALEALGILRPRSTSADYVAPALFAVLLTTLLGFYIIRLHPILIERARNLMLIAFLLFVCAAGIKIIAGEPSFIHYLYPLAAVPMLIAVLVDPLTGLVSTIFLALTLGFYTHNSLELTIYALAGGSVAALMLGRIERLPTLLWSGVYAGAANAAIVVIFRSLAHETDLTIWGQLIFAAIGNGALSGLLALGSLFILGKIFGITTSLELLDLARPTHPLLTKLMIEAPGTYHHSLIVSQLAERAAHRIDADALLVRVAAYYHDVGKIAAPQSFVENQMDGVNLHDALEPKQSANIVIDHVTRGIALAKQFGLPDQVRDFIPQHHGTTLAAYFHRKAVQANGNTPINENDYRYPGPKPQSRETAILMLADGVEATTRAERPSSPEQIRAIIDRIVNERLRDGQLSDSELTLHDLEEIKQAFFGVLQGLFHPRIKYPEPPEKTNAS